MFTIYRLKHEVSVEQQVSDIKLRFFTNISHELRTPLTFMACPVEYVLKNKTLPDDVREQLHVVERNTDRMLRLVNQILDFRKIQKNKMKLRIEQIDICLLYTSSHTLKNGLFCFIMIFKLESKHYNNNEKHIKEEMGKNCPLLVYGKFCLRRYGSN